MINDLNKSIIFAIQNKDIMALINVVKYEMQDGVFCSKFSEDDIRLGSQLIVYPAQVAFFVKGGQVLDEFTSGTYTITSENIPLLNKIINIPYGSDSPFKAEVWFINTISKLDMPWGTPQPIQIEDPKYHIIVPVRANGQYGLRVTNPRLFLETLIGNMIGFNSEKIDHYFKGRIISLLNQLIAHNIIENEVSVLDINTRLFDLSQELELNLNEVLSKYGVSIVEFSIMSINVPEQDESVQKLKQAKDLVARLNIAGKDVYQMERSFDVLEKAASNEGAGGGMAAMGVGLGAGVGVGSVVGNMAANMINTNPLLPPIPNETLYYIYVNGQQIGGQNEQQIASYINQGLVNGSTLVWTSGLPNWVKLDAVPSLSRYLSQTPPPITEQ